jgi:hypothetical protein
LDAEFESVEKMEKKIHPKEVIGQKLLRTVKNQKLHFLVTFLLLTFFTFAGL